MRLYYMKRVFVIFFGLVSFFTLLLEFGHIFNFSNKYDVKHNKYSFNVINQGSALQELTAKLTIRTTAESQMSSLRGPTPKPTIGTHVLQKLDTIYSHINQTKNNSIFPAFQIGDYLMQNPNLCRDADYIHIIIVVHTAPQNLVKRIRMRETFANRSLFYPFQVRIAFLLGKPKRKELMKDLELEHAHFNDTIMGDFYDDYHNLTLKGVMGFRWIREYCDNSGFILKIDDDVIIDMYLLLGRYLDHMKGKRKSIFCNVWRKNMGIMRDGKWKLPMHVFPKLKTFPYFYCSGYTLLMSSDMAGPLHEAAKITPFFWIDDLYLYGMLPKVVGGVTWYEYRIGANMSLSADKAMTCWKAKGDQCEYFSTLVPERYFYKYWSVIQSVHNKSSSWTAKTWFEP